MFFPGITGLWQVKARNNPSFEDYISLDLEYVQKRSLWFDAVSWPKLSEWFWPAREHKPSGCLQAVLHPFLLHRCGAQLLAQALSRTFEGNEGCTVEFLPEKELKLTDVLRSFAGEKCSCLASGPRTGTLRLYCFVCTPLYETAGRSRVSGKART